MDNFSGLSSELNETIERITSTINGQSKSWINVQSCVLYSTMALCRAVVTQQAHITALEQKFDVLSKAVEILIQDSKLKENRYRRNNECVERRWNSLESNIDMLTQNCSKCFGATDRRIPSSNYPSAQIEPKCLSDTNDGLEESEMPEYTLKDNHTLYAKTRTVDLPEKCPENALMEAVTDIHRCFISEHSKWVICGMATNYSSKGENLLWDYQLVTINNETSVRTSPGEKSRSKCFWWQSRSKVIILQNGLYRITAGICGRNLAGILREESPFFPPVIVVHVNGKKAYYPSPSSSSSPIPSCSNKKEIKHFNTTSSKDSPFVSTSILFIVENSMVEFRVEDMSIEISRCFLEIEFIV